MMLSIAILLGVAMILNIQETEGNYNTFMAAALCVSLYALNTTLFAITLCVLIFIGVRYLIENN